MILPGLLALLAFAPQQPANPHLDLGGLACTTCHVTSNWRDVAFDHGTTRFALRGRHQAAPCTGCHDLRDFRRAERSCGSCHEDPHRGDAGSSCVSCHMEASWRSVNPQDAHARSRLPELGAHAALRCQDCHLQAAARQFHGAVRPCALCHQQAWDATANPPHGATGIPRNCDQCHQLATWRFARFPQHDALFAIYGGEHAGRWRSCASCHPQPGNLAVYDCLSCHTQGPTTQQHQGMPGYQWASTACLSCHPGGRAGDLSFHEAIFPIFSAGHGGAWNACAQCHVDPANRTTVTCTGGGCHAQAATDATHSGIPSYGYTTPQCRSCHPDGRTILFTQHDAIFPIFSGPHRNRWPACASCHPDPSTRSVFSCFGSGCHQQAPMDDKHRNLPGYSFTPAACLSCHPDGTKP